MKTVLFLSFCFVAVSATFTDKSVGQLHGRVLNLIEKANKIVDHYRIQSRAHLLSTVESELMRLGRFSQKLKQLDSDTNSTVTSLQVHLLEETLLYHENRLAEEFDIVGQITTYRTTEQNVNDLLERAGRLVKSDNVDIMHHHVHGHREIIDLELEKIQINKLIKQLKAYPLQHVAKLEEEALVRHELSLQNLYKRIEH